MSDSTPPPVIPPWLSRAIVTLLVLQVGLLWVHGSLLQRQHDDVQALRQDVQSLAESLDQDSDGGDSDDGEPAPYPARQPLRHHRGRLVRAAYARAEEPGNGAPDPERDPALSALKKDVEDTRQSERDAIAKAREAQEKVSIAENIRKADEKARIEAETNRWTPLLWIGVGVALVGILARSLLRRRG